MPCRAKFQHDLGTEMLFANATMLEFLGESYFIL